MRTSLFKKVTIGLLVLVMVLGIIPADSVAAATKDWQYFRFKGKMEVSPGFDPRNYVDVEDAEKMYGSIKKVNSTTYNVTIYQGTHYYLQCNPTCKWVEEYVDGLWQYDNEVCRPWGEDEWCGVQKDKYYIATTYDYKPDIYVDVEGADKGRLRMVGSVPEGMDEYKTTINVWIAKNYKRVSGKLTFNVTIKAPTGGKTIYQDFKDRAIEAGKKEKSDIMKFAVVEGFLDGYLVYEDSSYFSQADRKRHINFQDLEVLRSECIRDYPSLRYGVCGDSAHIRKELFEAVGLQCEYIEFPCIDMRHAGNIVVIDGKTYYVDSIAFGPNPVGGEDYDEDYAFLSDLTRVVIERKIKERNFPPLEKHGIDLWRDYREAYNAYKAALEQWPNQSVDAYDYENDCCKEGWIWDTRLVTVRRPNEYLDKKLRSYCEEQGIDYNESIK